MLDQTDPRRILQRDLSTLAQEAQYLNKLPPQQALDLTLAGEVVQFPEKSIIISQGSRMEEVYLILRGLAVAGLYEDVDPALWLYICGPNAIVDTSALLEPPVSLVTVRALTEVEALAIPRETFVEAMRREPAIGYEVLQALASRLALINRVSLKELGQEYPGPSLN